MSRNKKKAAEKAAEIPVEAPEETPVAENDEELTRVREELKTAQEDLTKKQKELDETIRLLQRNQADFENYRRRNNSVRAESYENGKRDAVMELLPSLDDFERIVSNADKGITSLLTTDLLPLFLASFGSSVCSQMATL